MHPRWARDSRPTVRSGNRPNRVSRPHRQMPSCLRWDGGSKVGAFSLGRLQVFCQSARDWVLGHFLANALQRTFPESHVNEINDILFSVRVMSFRFAADPPRRFSPRSVNLRAFTRLWRGETDRPHDTAAIAMSFLGLVNSGGALGDLGGSPRVPLRHAGCQLITQRIASTTLANSTSRRSSVVLTTGPLCAAITG